MSAGKPKAALRTKRNPAAADWLKTIDMHIYGKVKRGEHAILGAGHSRVNDMAWGECRAIW